MYAAQRLFSSANGSPPGGDCLPVSHAGSMLKDGAQDLPPSQAALHRPHYIRTAPQVLFASSPTSLIIGHCACSRGPASLSRLMANVSSEAVSLHTYYSTKLVSSTSSLRKHYTTPCNTYKNIKLKRCSNLNIKLRRLHHQ